MADSDFDPESVDISKIAGSAPDEVKRMFGDPGSLFINHRPFGVEHRIFGEDIQKRLKVTEISIVPKAEESKKMEAKFVMETEVAEGMIDHLALNCKMWGSWGTENPSTSQICSMVEVVSMEVVPPFLSICKNRAQVARCVDN